MLPPGKAIDDTVRFRFSFAGGSGSSSHCSRRIGPLKLPDIRSPLPVSRQCFQSLKRRGSRPSPQGEPR